MRQLLQNLIGNALKYHRKGEAPVVTVSTTAGDTSSDTIQLIVEDNGIGFDPEYAERIFGVFERLHGRDAYPGTGIGPAHRSADRRAAWRDRYGNKRTRAGLDLHRDPAIDTTQVWSIAMSNGPFHILIADDDPDDRLFTQEAFAEARLDNPLSFVSDGQDLLDFLKRKNGYTHETAPRPGLILLDLNMPRKDGREALAEIKADPDLRDIPVVVLTTFQGQRGHSPQLQRRGQLLRHETVDFQGSRRDSQGHRAILGRTRHYRPVNRWFRVRLNSSARPASAPTLNAYPNGRH